MGPKQLITIIIFIKITIITIHLIVYIALFYPCEQCENLSTAFVKMNVLPTTFRPAQRSLLNDMGILQQNATYSFPSIWPLPPSTLFFPPAFQFLPCYLAYLFIVYLLFILRPPLLECKIGTGISSVHCILVSLQVPSAPNLLSWLSFALILPPPDGSRSALIYPTHFRDGHNSFCSPLLLTCSVVEK